MNILDTVVFRLNRKHAEFSLRYLALFHDIIEHENERLFVKRSDSRYFPRVEIDCHSKESRANVVFLFSNGREHKVDVANETGISKKSGERYSPLELDDVVRRCERHAIKILRMDHIGFNMPWFAGGIHPKIRKLRAAAAGGSLYHAFPSGEPWDFILPASKDEIEGALEPDYSAVRKPKIEIVSFDKCSVPLIQFDVSCSAKKDVFSTVFPEGLYDQDYGNIWLYIKNPFDIDLCLVLNEEFGGDWSGFFRDSRL